MDKFSIQYRFPDRFFSDSDYDSKSDVDSESLSNFESQSVSNSDSHFDSNSFSNAIANSISIFTLAKISHSPSANPNGWDDIVGRDGVGGLCGWGVGQDSLGGGGNRGGVVVRVLKVVVELVQVVEGGPGFPDGWVGAPEVGAGRGDGQGVIKLVEGVQSRSSSWSI